ncbi:MAG: LuxR C-terminal-related transcriptional regulator [Chloroflexota bacterium]
MSRPRLLETLREGSHRKLTLISAPAGFGKTTLVSAWLDTESNPVAWFSLDAHDSDPTRFLMYLVAAVRTIVPHMGDDLMGLLDAPEPPAIQSLLVPLLNDLATLPEHFIVVLDDYHVIDSPEIDTALAFLINNQPPQMHLVITTREDPRLPLARLRARRQLTEIRAIDLRFTPDETSNFLNEIMGLALSPADIAALDARTEGWIVGLQLAALSMQGQSDPRQFIASFSGSHRFVLDYLVEEVLRQQPEHVHSFLLQTSLLDRFNADLCDFVTEREDSQAILEQLERSNLLIVPLDNDRNWYRYHHLFAEVLQTYALKAHAEQRLGWQLRASQWHEQNGFRIEAIRYAFAAQDMTWTASLVEQTWPEMFYGVRPMQWLAWAKQLPEDQIRVRPVLSAAYAWMLLDEGELEKAEARLQVVESWLDMVERENGHEAAQDMGMVIANHAEYTTLVGSTASARAYLSLNKGELTDTVAHAQQALSLLGDADYFWRGNTALFLGLAQWSSGDFENAYHSIMESVDSQRKAGSHYFETFGTVMLGDIRAAQGCLREAHAHYQQALRLVSPDTSNVEASPSLVQGPVALYTGLAEVHREWNDLQAADHNLRLGEEVVEQAILPGNAYRLACAAARVRSPRGDFEGALRQLDEAERLWQPSAVPDLRPIPALRAQIWLQQGDLSKASAWVQRQGFSVDDTLTVLNTYTYLVFARVLIAQSEQNDNAVVLKDALRLLERLRHTAEHSDQMSTVIEVSITAAVAYQLHGDTDTALTHLHQALKLAEPEGYMRVFLDAGAAIEPLLATSLRDGVTSAYVTRLLTDLQRHTRGGEIAPDPNQLLIEPLSNRELDVLRLIAAGHTNQAIADELVIALSTVKKHINSIYGKLGVSNRTQALNRAREIGLL